MRAGCVSKSLTRPDVAEMGGTLKWIKQPLGCHPNCFLCLNLQGRCRLGRPVPEPFR